MALSVTTIPQEDGSKIFAFDGRLDVKASRDAEEVFSQELAEPTDVILDMADLSYIASAGLRLIKRIHNAVGDAGCKVTVRNVNEDVMDVFEMTGFAAMMSIE